MKEITLDSSVAEVVEQHPEVIPAFLRRGMACVGCEMALFETVGGAALIYHVDGQTLVEELRTLASAAE